MIGEYVSNSPAQDRSRTFVVSVHRNWTRQLPALSGDTFTFIPLREASKFLSLRARTVIAHNDSLGAHTRTYSPTHCAESLPIPFSHALLKLVDLRKKRACTRALLTFSDEYFRVRSV